MPKDYVIKAVPATRLVALTATLDPADLGHHIEAMFVRVGAALEHEAGALDTPVATYAETGDGMDVVVGYVHEGPASEGLVVVDLPPVDAVCGVHRGTMATVRASWQDLQRWVADSGFVASGPWREVYVRAGSADQADWITELQQPVSPTGA